jgi:hypothetical protein
MMVFWALTLRRINLFRRFGVTFCIPLQSDELGLER